MTEMICPHCHRTSPLPPEMPAAPPAAPRRQAKRGLSLLTLPEHPGPNATQAAIFKSWKTVSPYRAIEAFIDRCGFHDLAERAATLQHQAPDLTRAQIFDALTRLQDERRQRTSGTRPPVDFATFAAGWQRIERRKARAEKAERRRRQRAPSRRAIERLAAWHQRRQPADDDQAA